MTVPIINKKPHNIIRSTENITTQYLWHMQRSRNIPDTKIGTSDIYMEELFGILLGINTLQAICPRHNVKKLFSTIGCGGYLAVRSAQDNNISHPIDTANADLRGKSRYLHNVGIHCRT